MTSTEMITVIIADDHPLVRFAVRQSLEAENDIEVLGEARTGKEIVDLAHDLRPDAVVLDYRMPVMDGMSAARIIAQELPVVSILMLTAEEDPVLVEEAIRAGIHGLVQKSDPADVLPHRVREAVAGRTGLRVMVEPERIRHLGG
ncbi:MAG TPA: response regulator transcription factor [Actinomycetota bacterium]|jgi:DNA-binding NarL/FixJ family response regulator|nr:response regulator transcription factor [Actinomycetota bacterium]